MKQRVKSIVQGLMCILNRHDYIVRIACHTTGHNLRTCKNCGKFD